MRQALALGIGTIVGIGRSKILAIAKQKPYKQFDNMVYVYEGKFSDLPRSIDELIKCYPEMRLREQKRVLQLNKDGNPSLDLTNIAIANLPNGTVFHGSSTKVISPKHTTTTIKEVK